MKGKLSRYAKNKNNVNVVKNNLENLLEILDIKLKIIQGSKKIKYYGKAFQKNMNTYKLYKSLIKENINKMKIGLKTIQKLEIEIPKVKNQINYVLENKKITDNGKNYFGKNEINNIYNNLCEKIKNNSNKIKDNFEYKYDGDNNSYCSNFDIVDKICKDFGNLFVKIEKEKEEL